MNDGNYIKLFRSFLDWEWYMDINTGWLFLHMLLKANWKEGNFKGTTVPRGSFISSIDKLSDGTGLTKDEVRTAIKHLISTNEITKQSTNKYTVFSVVNYELYQHEPKQEPKQEPNDSQAITKLFPTIEERKKEKKEEGKKEKKEIPYGTKKKEPTAYYPNDEKLNQAFADYVQMRKLIKKPMTDRAVSLAMKKLQELSTSTLTGSMDNDTAIKILEQSVMNGWQGLLPLKESGSTSQKRESSIYDEWRNA